MAKGKKGKHDRPSTRRVTRSQKRAQGRFFSTSDHGDLNTQLRELGLCTKDITGDGNCLFRALSDQYYGIDGNHKAIRQEVCQFLKDNEEIYKFFVEDDQSFEHHVECMSQDATFGGNMELAAFAKLKGVDIKVYQPGMVYIINGKEGVEETEEEKSEEAPQVLHIAYHSWEHYSSVRNIDGPYSGPPEIKVVKAENGKEDSKEANDQEEEEAEIEYTSQEKVVLSACPGTNIRKVRRLLVKYKQNPDKAIDALYEPEVVIENLDPIKAAADPVNDVGKPSTEESEMSPKEDEFDVVNTNSTADKDTTTTTNTTTTKSDVPAKNEEKEETVEKVADEKVAIEKVAVEELKEEEPDKKADEENKEDTIKENVEDVEEEKKDDEGDKSVKKEEKPKKMSASERKKERKRIQKENAIAKARAKAQRKANYKQSNDSNASDNTTESPKPQSSMKEMYI